jgi:hypothetical protein
MLILVFKFPFEISSIFARSIFIGPVIELAILSRSIINIIIEIIIIVVITFLNTEILLNTAFSEIDRAKFQFNPSI